LWGLDSPCGMASAVIKRTKHPHRKKWLLATVLSPSVEMLSAET